ncbi:unnamed protein product [Allacma fusca]|uniref:Uncharacterized protein n=1 Tax=Allacma fusca TaxID=39272 RepID=A0A8J2PRF7_9HEXA|nr:unnamed protein product [Allacma fusca]
MSFYGSLPLGTIDNYDAADTSVHPFLFAGDGKNEMEKIRNLAQALFPSRSSQCVNENCGWDQIDMLFKPSAAQQVKNCKTYMKRYTALRLPKLSHTTSRDSSNFIFTKNLQPFFLQSESDGFIESSIPEYPRERMTGELEASCSSKSVRINVPKKTESLDGSTNRVVLNSKNRRHSSGNANCKRKVIGNFHNNYDNNGTGTASATAKLGAVCVKDSLTLIRTSVRKQRRNDSVREGSKDEIYCDSQSVPKMKTGSKTRSRSCRQKELRSLRDAEKNSRLVRAKLVRLQKSLEKAELASLTCKL